MKLETNIITPQLKLKKNTADKSQSKVGEKVVTYSGDVDYNENVINKPTLNGKEIIGDITEEDPSMVAIDLTELSNMFNSVFN